ADIRFKNGAVTELDPMQALSLLRNTEASVPQLQTLIKQSKYAISTLLGMPPSNLENILTGTSQIPVPPSKITLGIPAELLRRRPDVRLAELRAAAQSANIGIAKSELFPRFILLGSIGFESSDKGSFSASNGAHLNDLFNGSSFTWFVGPSVNWNILNYGRIKNDVRVQDARFQELIVDYQDAVLNAAREVEHGVVGFIGKQEEVVFLQSAVKAAKHSVDLAQIQYRDGAVDYIRVLDTQQNLFSQQDRLTSNKGQINNNLIAIYKAMGGGWELRKGHSFVPVNIRQEMRERTDWGDFMTETMPEDQPEAPPAASDQSLFPSIGFW
ncbi:MAG: TolC family protein, partial [Methylococcales bacterium]|nr:TolC family protein [Methylococcales bacterium]